MYLTNPFDRISHNQNLETTKKKRSLHKQTIPQ